MYTITTYTDAARNEQFETIEEVWTRAHWLQAEGVTHRFDFAATVALAQRGAFPMSWEQARKAAVDQWLAENPDTGHGLGSSDCNHLTVSYLYGAPVGPQPHAMALPVPAEHDNPTDRPF